MNKKIIKSLRETLFIGFTIVVYIYFSYKTLKIEDDEVSFIKSPSETESVKVQGNEPRNRAKLRYILLWTDPKTVPFCNLGVGQNVFIERKCPHVNCYVTADKDLLEDITMFDVIAFAGPQMFYTRGLGRPYKRSPHQKYVFASIESSGNYPMCDPTLDKYFNWTWTYKLDSDSRWGYLVVRDINGTVIGPNEQMNWIKHENMFPVTNNFKQELKKKNKLAAWFVSNCITGNRRENYIKDLQKALSTHNRSIDIYGRCGKLKCPRNDKLCLKMIQDKYYFYMAFENAFSVDYVTEKVLNGLQNNAVPIVYGGANYSRFLPPRSYINARNLNVYDLASKMIELVENFDEYVEYFRWMNHYTISSRSSSVTTDSHCSICALVSDNNKFYKHTVYKEFRKWWNPSYTRCK